MTAWILSTAPGYLRVAPDDGGAFTPVAAFSTRRGGVSGAPFATLNLSEGVGDDARAVHANRARLLGALDLDPARVAWATQVHGAHVLTPRGPGLAGTGDALVTRIPALVLVVGAADCLAVLLWDEEGHVVGAAHAGWRGTVAGVVPRLVATMAAAGATPARLTAALGPRIGPCCFAVGPDVAARFDARHVTTGRPDSRGASPVTVDLAAAVTAQLAAAGVPAGRIADSAACTACDAATYYSHRRDQGRTGRAWGVIALRRAGPRSAREGEV
jgi:hypothetical protein